MTFIIILVALLLERFFHWHYYRPWQGFLSYENWLNEYSVRLPDVLRLAISVLPALVIVGLLQYLLSGWLYGLLELIFGVVVLLYCFGPYNLWVQIYRYIDELQKEDPELAIEQAKKSFGVVYFNNSQIFHKSLIRAIFIAAHERIFAVICWFLLLGPVGAVLYRLIDLFSIRQESGLADVASKTKNIMDWVPVRIFTFVFALGGHFTEVYACWRAGLDKDVKSNYTLLAECGVAALDVMEADQIPETGDAERETIELLDRVFAMILVLLAIIVIIF